MERITITRPIPDHLDYYVDDHRIVVTDQDLRYEAARLVCHPRYGWCVEQHDGRLWVPSELVAPDFRGRHAAAWAWIYGCGGFYADESERGE